MKDSRGLNLGPRTIGTPLLCITRAWAVVPAALFLWAVFPATAHATMQMSVPENTTGANGQELEIPISVDDGTGILGYFFELSYDPAILEYVNTDKGTLTSGWGIPTANPQSGRVSVAGLGATPLSGSGSLAVVRLRIKWSATNGQTSPLHFEAAELNDGAIPVSTSDGLVAVCVPVLVSVPVGIVEEPGTEIQVPISLDDGSGVLGYFIWLFYDHAILEYLGTGKGSLITGWGDPVVNAQPGSVSVAGLGVTPLSGSGSLAIMQMRVRSSATTGQTSPLHFEAAELNDGQIPVQMADGEVIVAGEGEGEWLPLAAWPVMFGLLITLSVVRLWRTRGNE